MSDSTDCKPPDLNKFCIDIRTWLAAREKIPDNEASVLSAQLECLATDIIYKSDTSVARQKRTNIWNEQLHPYDVQRMIIRPLVKKLFKNVISRTDGALMKTLY